MTEKLNAVRQAVFVRQYKPIWVKFDEIIASDDNSDELVRLYRQICTHYALAVQRHYSPMLTDELHKRVLAGHGRLYQAKSQYLSKTVQFIVYTFPNELRRHKKLFWVSFGLFYVPCVLMAIACYLNDELIYSVMSYIDVATMEQMYDPANREIGRDRQADTDLMMFGHYVRNNIGIDFQVYGLGLFLGIGTMFITLYNGVVIGAVAGHLTQAGFGGTFWQFVLGHGSFELTAVVVSAAAGLRLGMGIVSPAPYGRKEGLVIAGHESIQLLLGAGFMTFIAAFIEAFWSSSSMIPPVVKYVVALMLWLFVGWYLLYCGKDAKHNGRNNNKDNDDKGGISRLEQSRAN